MRWTPHLREDHHVVEESPEGAAWLMQRAYHGHTAVDGDAAQHVEDLVYGGVVWVRERDAGEGRCGAARGGPKSSVWVEGL